MRMGRPSQPLKPKALSLSNVATVTGSPQDWPPSVDREALTRNELDPVRASHAAVTLDPSTRTLGHSSKKSDVVTFTGSEKVCPPLVDVRLKGGRLRPVLTVEPEEAKVREGLAIRARCPRRDG